MAIFPEGYSSWRRRIRQDLVSGVAARFPEPGSEPFGMFATARRST